MIKMLYLTYLTGKVLFLSKRLRQMLFLKYKLYTTKSEKYLYYF